MTSIDIKRFNKYASCPNSIEQPSIDSNFIKLPVASNIPTGCSINFLDAVSLDTFQLGQLSFDARFRGTNTAPSASEEEAVFVAQDTINWNGPEFGFILTNDTNSLKGYIQDGDMTPYPPGWHYFDYLVLEYKSDGLLHNYRMGVEVDRNKNNKFFWYIDGELRGTKTYKSPLDHVFTNLNYHIIGTTHRTIDGWNSDLKFLEFGNLDWYKYSEIARNRI